MGRFGQTLGIALLCLVLNTVSSQWLEDCGVSKYSDAGTPPGETIVGGWTAREHEWPWQVSMHRLRDSGEFTHSCGGSIINERWILSAAHCVDTSAVETLQIHVGEHNLSDVSNTQRRVYDVETIIFHEAYNTSTTENDIAVLRLTDDVELNENVTSVCPADASVNYEGQECVVSGWGVERFGAPDIPDTLKFTWVPITVQQDCVDRYAAIGNVITDDMICAGATNETEDDACQGDSGGPLVCQNSDGRWEEVGVVSWGFGCASRMPGVYARVTYFLDWIEDSINSYEATLREAAAAATN